MKTGETRCVFDDGLIRLTRNGFFDGTTAYNFQCAPIWRLEVGDKAKTHRVDGGVVSVERVGDESIVTYFG